MNYRSSVYLLFLALAIALAGCVPYEEEELTDIKIDLRDSLFQRIYTFQHEQLTDSLKAYLGHKDPTYRYLSAIAFGSIRDSTALDTLAVLLDDRVDEVRAAAAYALGQMGMAAAEPFLVRAFDQYDTAGLYRKANRAILEAIGKVGSEKSLQALATISTYRQQDTALLEGQALGIYRFALRDITSPEGTAHMLKTVTDLNMPVSARFIAAHYLHRSQKITLDSLAGLELARVMSREEDPRIRMTLASGLGKVKTQTALDALLAQYRKDQDYRVKCAILRVLGNFPYEKVQATVLEALKDKNRHIAELAGEFFVQYGIAQDAPLYWRLTRDSLPWQAQLPLFSAAFRHMPAANAEMRENVNFQLRRRFQQAQSPFVKAAAIRRLGDFPWNYRFIYREGFRSPNSLVRQAAVETLGKISRLPAAESGLNSSSIARELAFIFVEAVRSGEPGLIMPATEALLQPERNFRAVFDSLGFLDKAIARIDSTRDPLTLHALRKTQRYLQGDKTPLPEPVLPVKPIDWSLLTASSVEPLALIQTNKGVIQIKLLPKIAPASVANFIQLAKEGFYKKKYFYRVVPNFVIQGAEAQATQAEAFRIRSELPPLYYDEAGMVGMASSGRHTENTQFFITHTPTPHLDGNYTLFGRVVEGMDVVNQIFIGDQIEEIIVQ